MAIKTVSYAASDIGKHRSSNQDSGYAGYQLFFVADGMGGHAGGDIASAITSQRVALTDNKYDSAEEAIETLKQGILEANDMLSETVKEHPELEGMGTTFSGMPGTLHRRLEHPSPHPTVVLRPQVVRCEPGPSLLPPL